MGEVFDLFCGAVEAASVLKSLEFGGRPLKEVMRNAALFEIPVTAQKSDLIPSQYSDDEIAFLAETFFLPFPTIIVEDNAGCVLLQDIDAEQKGLSRPRRFIGVGHTSRLKNFSADISTRLAVKQQIAAMGHHMHIVMGVADIRFEQGGHFAGTVDLQSAFGVFDNGRSSEESNNDSTTAKSAGNDVITAYQEIIAINTPHRFVVKEQPIDVARRYREADAERKVLRSSDRPKYTLLTPTEIKTRFGLGPKGAELPGIARAPHQRRRH